MTAWVSMAIELPDLDTIRRWIRRIVELILLGGIGLSGGKGGMRNVIVGALLIGIMLNAMTIIDIPHIYQSLIKATILLIAINVACFKP